MNSRITPKMPSVFDKIVEEKTMFNNKYFDRLNKFAVVSK